MAFTSTRAFRAAPTDGVTFYPRVFGSRGAVAAEHYSAALAGIEILRMGGNAIDAACTAALVEGVVNPHMHTIGGELPILIATPDGTVTCINGNMAAPGKATPQAFRDLGHDAIPAEGVLSGGVPGVLGAIVEALSRFGRLSFEQVSDRAIELARDGFPAHSGLPRQHKSGITENAENFARWPGTAAIYLPDGRVPQEGELLRNPALAQMFAHLVEAERRSRGDRQKGLRAVFDAFYRGDIAAQIVAFVKQEGGLLERSGLRRLHHSGRSQCQCPLCRRGHPQMRPLEPGPGTAADPHHPQAVRPSGDGPQFARLYPHRAGGDEARLRRPRAILWRSRPGRCADGGAAVGFLRQAARQP